MAPNSLRLLTGLVPQQSVLAPPRTLGEILSGRPRSSSVLAVLPRSQPLGSKVPPSRLFSSRPPFAAWQARKAEGSVGSSLGLDDVNSWDDKGKDPFFYIIRIVTIGSLT